MKAVTKSNGLNETKGLKMSELSKTPFNLSVID
jgi:hypothetical protein